MTKEEYDVLINGEAFKIIKKLDAFGKLIFIKAQPKEQQGVGATVLDQPSQINWKRPQSHLTYYGCSVGDRRVGTTRTGSVFISDTVMLTKSPDDQAVAFPIPTRSTLGEQQPISMDVKGNLNIGSVYAITVNTPTWVAVVSYRDPTIFGTGTETPYYDMSYELNKSYCGSVSSFNQSGSRLRF